MRARTGAFLLSAVLLIACDLKDLPQADQGSGVSDTRLPDFDWTGTVRHVVDGDSLYIKGVEPQIRLWGVDAPERDERGYQTAKDKLIDLAKGERIGCETKDIDKYDRIVGRCFVVLKNLEINKELIESGVSQEYCRFTKNYYRTCDF